MEENKKTILYEKHQGLGATIVPFGGFLMPLYYSNISDEHHSVRTNVGMFDVSHMGEILITGKDAYAFINYVLTSNISFKPSIQYGLLLHPNGFVIDDLMVYTLGLNEILLVVNASNTLKDFVHLQNEAKNFNVIVSDVSDNYGLIAVQGPNSYQVLSKLIPNLPESSSMFHNYTFEGEDLLISRSGYTGEDGFEVYANLQTTIKLWDILYQMGVNPIGLGARDTLRFEAAMPLYGHEISDEINPIEAGLSFACDFSKPNFIGKDALLLYKEDIKRKSVGIELLEKNIARADYKVFYEDQEIGYITTGYLSPSTKKAIAMALIDINYAKLGTIVYVKIRDKMIKAIIRNKKFIEKKNKL